MSPESSNIFTTASMRQAVACSPTRYAQPGCHCQQSGACVCPSCDRSANHSAGVFRAGDDWSGTWSLHPRAVAKCDWQNGPDDVGAVGVVKFGEAVLGQCKCEPLIQP